MDAGVTVIVVGVNRWAGEELCRAWGFSQWRLGCAEFGFYDFGTGTNGLERALNGETTSRTDRSGLSQCILLVLFALARPTLDE